MQRVKDGFTRRLGEATLLRCRAAAKTKTDDAHHRALRSLLDPDQAKRFDAFSVAVIPKQVVKKVREEELHPSHPVLRMRAAVLWPDLLSPIMGRKTNRPLLKPPSSRRAVRAARSRLAASVYLSPVVFPLVPISAPSLLLPLFPFTTITYDCPLSSFPPFSSHCLHPCPLVLPAPR